MSLLFKILKYEQEVFEKYLESRKKLLCFIKQVKINNLSNEKVLIFINDLKQVIDPIITCNSNIDYLISNNMESNDSIEYQKDLKEFFNLYLLLRLTGGGEESEELSELSELSVSELSELSEESELSVSVSELSE
jgi:hypothetical protein